MIEDPTTPEARQRVYDDLKHDPQIMAMIKDFTRVFGKPAEVRSLDEEGRIKNRYRRTNNGSK